MHLTLSGTCTKFEMFDKIRHHGTVQNLPFWQYLRCVSVSRFDGKSGRGQQRGIVDGQVKKLMKAMRDGEYTPVNLTASFDGPHPAKLVVDGDTFFHRHPRRRAVAEYGRAAAWGGHRPTHRTSQGQVGGPPRAAKKRSWVAG